MRSKARWLAGAWLVALSVWPARTAAQTTVIVSQHVENSGFAPDDGLRAWPRWGGGSWATTGWQTTGQSPASPGALRLLNSYVGTPGASARVAQCVTDIVGGGTYSVSAYWEAPAGQPLHANGGFVGVYLDFHADRACADLGFTSTHSIVTFGPAGNGGWQQLVESGSVAPAGAKSALIVLEHGRLSGQPAGASYVNFDRVGLLGPHAFVKGSLLNRGETDLLLRNVGTGEHRMWFMNDERLAGYAPIVPTPTLSWQAVGMDDFDGDGKNDLLMWHAANGYLDFWLMNAVNRIGAAVPIGGGDPGSAWRPSATADFNHDGQPDIVLRNPSTQQLYIWTLDGTAHVGGITPTPSMAVNAQWEIVGAGDLDGDGNTDLLWYNPTSGRIVYWLMNASVVRTTGAFANPMAAGSNNWKVLAMGDYGIGPGADALPATLDLVWRNATSGRLVVWYMDRSGNRTAGLFTDPPDLPAPTADWTVAGPR